MGGDIDSGLGDKGIPDNLTDGLGVKSGTGLNPVINTYIMPMVAELVRDQIALIILTEVPNQKAIAEDLAVNAINTLQGRQAAKDLEDGIYDIIGHIYIEKGADFMQAELPGLNIYYSRSDFSATSGNNIEQVTNSPYAIGVHVTRKDKKKGTQMIRGDERSARMTTRILGILRAILMSGQYDHLGSAFDGIIWKRRVTGLNTFLPDFQEADGRHGLVGVLNLDVQFRESAPQLQGVELDSIVTAIRAKLNTAGDGKVILIENTEEV